MTLSTPTNRVAYNGDGSTTAFAIPFLFFANSHIVAVLRDADGVETTWVLDTQYALTGAGVVSGGTLTVDTSPTDYTPEVGETLVISRRAPLTQETDYPEGGAFPASAHEDALDKLTMLVQQLDEVDDRALHYPLTDAAALSAELPHSVDRASKYLAFDAAGEPIASAAAAGEAVVSAFMETVLDDTTAAAARATLAAAGTGVVNTFTATQSWAKGADVTSAATLVLGTDGNMFDVAGSTGPIAAITVAAGTLFMLQFDSTPTLTHHATALNLPGGANIVAAAGDRLIGFATAANTVHVLHYVRADGTLFAGVATQAQMEAGSSLVVAVPPGRQNFHPSSAKAWCYIARGTGVPVLSSPDYNVESLTDDGTANTIVTLDVDMSGTVYVAGAAPVFEGAVYGFVHTLAAASFEVANNSHDANQNDTCDMACWAFGDQA